MAACTATKLAGSATAAAICRELKNVRRCAVSRLSRLYSRIFCLERFNLVKGARVSEEHGFYIRNTFCW